MHDRGKSDRSVLPAKPPNNAADAVAEVVEGRDLAKGNTTGKTRPGLRAGVSASSALDRVRRIAAGDKDARFTALLHHVDVDRLRAAYWALKPKAAAGVDGVMWADYGEELEEEPSRSPRPGPSWELPSEAVTEGVHTEGGRAASTARDRVA